MPILFVTGRSDCVGGDDDDHVSAQVLHADRFSSDNDPSREKASGYPFTGSTLRHPAVLFAADLHEGDLLSLSVRCSYGSGRACLIPI